MWWGTSDAGALASLPSREAHPYQHADTRLKYWNLRKEGLIASSTRRQAETAHHEGLRERPVDVPATAADFLDDPMVASCGDGAKSDPARESPRGR
jgi:hypothetical protein